MLNNLMQKKPLKLKKLFQIVLSVKINVIVILHKCLTLFLIIQFFVGVKFEEY